VASGAVGYRLGPTRTEADFAQYLAALLAADSPEAFWHLVMDNLNIHGFDNSCIGRNRPRTSGYVFNIRT